MIVNLILAAVLSATTPQFEVQLLDGQTLVGTIASSQDEQITIDTADGPVAVEAEKLLRIVPRTAPTLPMEKPTAWIELVDGSSIMASEYSVGGEHAQVTLLGGQTVELPIGLVRTARLMEFTESSQPEWIRIGEMKHDSDVLVTIKEDAVNYYKGVLHDVDSATIQFVLGERELAVKRTKALGLIYYRRPNGELPSTFCSVTDAGGSRWPVAIMAVDGDNLQLTTPGGVIAKLPWSEIADVDFSGGKISYLSDLDPESLKWTPYFGSSDNLPSMRKFFSPKKDKNLGSKELKLDKKTYAKGIAMHSRCEVVYRLPDRFSRFKAVAGIDDAVRPNGNVRLVISGDDKTLFDESIDGSDEPLDIDLDISGVRRITILVDFGEGLSVADHLDLCEARVVK